jgi:hypothetical protein
VSEAGGANFGCFCGFSQESIDSLSLRLSACFFDIYSTAETTNADEEKLQNLYLREENKQLLRNVPVILQAALFFSKQAREVLFVTKNIALPLTGVPSV